MCSFGGTVRPLACGRTGARGGDGAGGHMTISLQSWQGLVAGLVLLLATVPLASRLRRREGDPWLGRVLLWAAFLKLLAAPAQIYIVDHFYKGVADANTYSKA